MIDMEKAKKSCEEITRKLSDLTADAETLGAIDEAIDLIHALIEDCEDLYESRETYICMNNVNADTIKNLMSELTRRDAETVRKNTVYGLTDEFGWLTQLEEKVKEWKWMVEKETIVMNTKC